MKKVWMDTAIITSDDLSYAVEVIKRGGLVAVPTDTVYGLAGNGLDEQAVARIYEVKGRPAVKPIILLVSGVEAASELCSEFPDAARVLAEAFWPGSLSLVLPKSKLVPAIVTAGGDTIGVRCPNHAKTLRLINLAGVPLAAPSANPTDLPSPTSARDVLEYFDGKIECIIDGGPCSVGVESTIADMTVQPPRILRHGAIPEAELLAALAKSSVDI
ncbi:MAG: L-threonylcarbamoyladenylate synthase [Oscillospiraceae bacterium]|nr:L-threonylcarbamoyladenylate synthase [Oscillospiraceae bacterium]